MPPKKPTQTVLRDTLPSTTLIPNTQSLRKFVSRLPKLVLVDLVLIWLDHPLCPIPEPVDDEDEFVLEDQKTLDEKRALYQEYGQDHYVTKKVVIDRILGTDWVITRSFLVRGKANEVEIRIECLAGGHAGYAVDILQSYGR